MNFLERLSKNIQISNFTITRPVWAEFFQADWQTYRHDETNSGYWQFFESAYKGELHGLD